MSNEDDGTIERSGSRSPTEDDSEQRPVLEDLLERAKTLLSELETFRIHLKSVRQEHNVELAHFRGTVQSELGMLERLAQKPNNEATDHVARSSNLPFLETVWGTAKKSKGLVALQKRVFYGSGTDDERLAQGMRNTELVGSRAKHKGGKNRAAIVDAITDGGQTWTKVSLITNSRLLFDLAKQGWELGVSDSEDEDGLAPSADEDADVPLLKTAKELSKAAKSYRVRTKTPVVHLILPRLTEGHTAEIDGILEECRTAGVQIFCGHDLRPVPALEDAAPDMAPNPLSAFSDTLNIDCTILLALVSEFSHAKVSKEPWFHTALQRQVEIEGNENLLPSLLYPAMGGHKLVCTKEAAKRMKEIVATIGTPSEKARTELLMDCGSDRSREQLLDEVRAWSAYDVPSQWQLPITVVDQDEDGCRSLLSPEAMEVGESMTDINKSVFMYGWAAGRTTITSNRTVVRQIENGLERFSELDENVWPSIWLCPTARSLVGKEKRGEKKSEKRNGAMHLPDPLSRERDRRHGLDLLGMKEGHEVEDLRPNGYPCDEVLAAKNASER